MQHVLVTGGAGFIGSHVVCQLQQAGYRVTVLDNLCNSSAGVLSRIAEITGQAVPFIQADVRDSRALADAFETNQFDAVMHFAALKSVEASIRQPLSYYDNNVAGSLSLLHVMQKFAVRTLVFSSSATVYGNEAPVPYTENTPLGQPANPYGQSKRMTEHVLQDICASDDSWNVSLLRYFNPVGAHPSGLIGEDPQGVPDNLMPYIAQVATGKLEKLKVFGNDYDTPDGTGVRDYIHVEDLANGHIRALKELLEKKPGLTVYNLGRGEGHSVLEVIKAFEEASGVSIPYEIAPRRAGDLAAYWADPSLAEQNLGWQAEHDLRTMCQHMWNWVT